ncbi:MAG TPA: S8 family serine peptidase [Polyangiaceae bacterium]|nr:S8 family serine peptidase [Polyangiaceae bacterium]
MRAVLGALGLAAVSASRPADAGNAVAFDARFFDLFAHDSSHRHPFADASGKIPLVVELPIGRDARAMGWQPFAPGLGALRLYPSDVPAFQAKYPGARASMWPGFQPVLDQSARLNRTSEYRAARAGAAAPPAGTGRGVVIGIVDSGIDAAHADFRDASGSRVAWLLDMAHAPLGKHVELEDRFGCSDPMQTSCAVLDRADIDEAIAAGTNYAPSDLVGHGTHVASIAAGNGGALGRYLGTAPEATLIVAAVSRRAVESMTDVDIANGARFIFDRADEMGLPAVVNISLGGDFGPHDGTTPLEKALAAMVGPEHPGHSIVVAAGNSGAVYQADQPDQIWGIHTQARVDREVPVRVPLTSPGSRAGSRLTGVAYVWVTYGATDDIAIGLEGSQVSIDPVGIGKMRTTSSADSNLQAWVYNGVIADEIPLTADTHGAIVVWRGVWPADNPITLRIEGQGFVDAWVQSAIDKPSGGTLLFEVASRQGTIAVPATHPDLIAVGCTVNRTDWIDRTMTEHDVAKAHAFGLSPVDSACYFSSAGPTATGTMKPELSAPGAMVVAAMSKDTVPAPGHDTIFTAPPGECKSAADCKVIDETHAMLSGSSMSAPQVAGAVALLLEKDGALTQRDILLLLEQGSRRPTGTVLADYQLGVGALDVVGAMAAYDARTTAVVRAPDAFASWMSLSDSYARPDVSSAVLGNVMIRASDGAIADGFDPAIVALTVEGGSVRRPLTRIAPGLWSFEVSGAPGGGSQPMQIDVTVDGTSIGQEGSRLAGRRRLAVGADRWIALGTARAYGGCAMAARRSSSPGGASAVLLAALLRVGLWRSSARRNAVRMVRCRDRKDRRA